MNYSIWTIVLVLITYTVLKLKKNNNYFKKWGIPQPRESLFSGVTFSNLICGKNLGILLRDIYNLNKDAKYIGFHMMNNRVIMLRDPELIKCVLVKNFDNFAHKRIFVDEKADPLFGKNLAFINGEKWREVRTLLSPAFTSSKMRVMFGLISRCADNFSNQFLQLYGDEKNIDMKDVFTRYTNDVVATCAFGLEIDSLKDPENEFYVVGRRYFDFKVYSIIKFFFFFLFPNLAVKLGVSLVPKRYTDYFINVIKNTIKIREEKGIKRPDMLQLMMEARDTTLDADLLDITAQAFIFFLGGFETTSSHMCLVAHVLAVHQDVQEKLQAEIDITLQDNNNELTYEALNNMSYLDAVFNETMRMYPIAYLNRICSKDFELPPSLPNAKPYTVKTGDEILIPVSGIHADPKFHENPEIFDPSRYLNKKQTASDITNLGFGMGPRVCIGSRFAILETKALFAYLLSKCTLCLCEKSPVPFEYDRISYVPAAKKGFWLKLKPRK